MSKTISDQLNKESEITDKIKVRYKEFRNFIEENERYAKDAQYHFQRKHDEELRYCLYMLENNQLHYHAYLNFIVNYYIELLDFYISEGVYNTDKMKKLIKQMLREERTPSLLFRVKNNFRTIFTRNRNEK